MNGRQKTVLLAETIERIARSWWLVLLGLALGFAGGRAAMSFLPRTYEAETKIFVAPSRLPLEFVRNQTPDDISMRVASLRESVLSRPYLLKVASEIYGVDEARAEREHWLGAITSRLEASVIRFDAQRGAGVFGLAYRDADPQRAAAAVNMLASLFIEENVKLRTSQAETTTTVMESLADEARAQLERQEQAIASFKSQHLYELSDQREPNLQLLEGRRRDLEATERALAQEQNRYELLTAQKAMASSLPVLPAAPADHAETPEARTARLRRELAELRTRYTDVHPAVRAKTKELEDAVAAQPASPAPGADASSALAGEPLAAQIAGSAREIERLKREREQIRADLARLNQRLESAPRVEQQFSELTKGYDVLQERYKNYQTSLENARGTRKVEQARQGEQFQVIERAIPPLFPISPSPMFVYPFGIMAGLVLCVGPLVVGTLLQPRIRSRQGLRAASSVPVLVVVGRVETQTARRQRRVRRLLAALVTVASVALLALAAVAFPR